MVYPRRCNMRIELNSGGLCSSASISSMQSDVYALIGKSESLLSAFKAIKSYAYNMNGGVGNLQNALGEVDTRIQTEEQRQTSLGETNTKIKSFIELTRSVDLSVSKLVDKNKREFYENNLWAKPTLAGTTEKSFGEKAWEWLCGVGDAIAETAKKAWDGIKSFCSAIKEKISKIGKAIHDFVFPKRALYDSKNGCYGGDQMVFQSASEAERKYREIFEKNNPGVNYTDKQFKNYMKKLTSEGCGYIALVNTICQQYEGREEEFEATFGYPMYKLDGSLNYEILTVDLYSRMDNRDANGNLDVNMDYDSGEDGERSYYYHKDDSTGWGTTPEQWKYYLTKFMEEHGVNVKLKTVLLLLLRIMLKLLRQANKLLWHFIMVIFTIWMELLHSILMAVMQ